MNYSCYGQFPNPNPTPNLIPTTIVAPNLIPTPTQPYPYPYLKTYT